MDSLKALEVRVDKDKHALIVNFPNNFFSAGQHHLSAEQVRSMTDFLQVLSPYQSTLNIYFEGHADQQPVQKSRTALLTDNFVLSSLRASSALLLAKKLGYSEKNMFISAASSNLRNTRSLTVRIEPKEEEL
ncbi:flagellar motor protein MotD [compost metagenome]